MRRKNWIRASGKSRITVSESEKENIQKLCEKFIETTLSSRAVRPFNPSIKLQQCIAIKLLSRGNLFRFAMRINDTRNDVIESEYDVPFARLEYRVENQFLCGYMRHTGAWLDLTFGMPVSLTAALSMIAEEPHFDIAFMFGS